MGTIRIAVTILTSVALILAPGCSAFVPATQRVVITPSIPDADITVDGKGVGRGSQIMELARNKTHTVTAESFGRQGAAAINKKISGTGILDIVGGIFFLVPFIGVVTPGFWELEPTEVNVIIPYPPPRAGVDARPYGEEATSAAASSIVRPFQPYTPPPGQSVVYIYRPPIGGTGVIYVKCGQTKLGGLSENGFTAAFIPPGRHVVSAATETTSEVTFEAVAGQSYYIEATVQPIGPPRLMVIPEQTGKSAILGTRWSGQAN